MGLNIVALIQRAPNELFFDLLKAPIEMVTAPHTPVPFSGALED